MHYALYIPNFGPFGDARTLANLASKAEKAGWDGFFIWDHIAGDLYSKNMVDPWVALAAIAMQTQNIRVGALVTPLPRRRPWKVARETSSIDHLSGGRLIFGVGSGGTGAEWERFGEVENLLERGEQLDEGLDILTGLWTGEPYSFYGKHYRVENQQFLPRPIQFPRIPIWVAGKWPHKKPFLRGIRYEGVFPIISYTPSYQNPPCDQALLEYKAFSHWIRPLVDQKIEFDLICRGMTTGENSSEDSNLIAEYVEMGYTWWLEHIIPENFGGKLNGEWHIEQMIERVLAGPPRAK